MISKTGSTMKQMAYAKHIMGGKGKTKKEMALNSGYSPYVSSSISSHIEKTRGFNNAMTQLAVESNNLALAALYEFKARGFKDFTNKELIGSLNAIGSAWSKFNPQAKEKKEDNGNNKLRTIVMNRIENQTITSSQTAPTVGVSEPSPIVGEVYEASDDPMDF